MFVPEFPDSHWEFESPPLHRRRPKPEWTTGRISIPVTHENSRDESEEESTSSGDGKREPRVHHIPITIEPRDDVPKAVPPVDREFYEWPRGGSVPRDSFETEFDSHPKFNRMHRDFDNYFEHQSPRRRAWSGDHDMPHQQPQEKAFPVVIEKHPQERSSPIPSRSTGRETSGQERSSPIPLRSTGRETSGQERSSPIPLRSTGRETSGQERDSPIPLRNTGRETSGQERDSPIPLRNTGRETGGHSKRKESSPSRPHISKVFVNSEEAPPQEDSKESVLLDKIKQIEQELEKWSKEVEQFTGEKKSKEYRYIDEMLTRCMLQLDNVETEGIEEVRLARKGAINSVQRSISHLETIAIENGKKAAQQQSEQVSEDVTMEPSESVVEKPEEKEVSMEQQSVTEAIEMKPAEQESQSQQVVENVEMDETKDSSTLIEPAKETFESQLPEPSNITIDTPENVSEDMEVDRHISEVILDINQPEPPHPVPTKRSELTIHVEDSEIEDTPSLQKDAGSTSKNCDK